MAHVEKKYEVGAIVFKFEKLTISYTLVNDGMKFQKGKQFLNMKLCEFKVIESILKNEDSQLFIEITSPNYKQLKISNFNAGPMELETSYQKTSDFHIRIKITAEEKEALREALLAIDLAVRTKKIKAVKKNEEREEGGVSLTATPSIPQTPMKRKRKTDKSEATSEFKKKTSCAINLLDSFERVGDSMEKENITPGEKSGYINRV